MSYWLVNQNRTLDQESKGNYMWAPKRQNNGARNPFYEFMREVAPGDIIFSYSKTHIVALGTALSYCYESPKPDEFGRAGKDWEDIGWKVNVQFSPLHNSVRPKSHIEEIRPFLPDRYSPLLQNGQVLRQAYLAPVSTPLALFLFKLIGSEADVVRDLSALSEAADPRFDLAREASLEEWEGQIESSILKNRNLDDTQRQALVLARRGQGPFRANVQTVEKACRVTGVNRLNTSSQVISNLGETARMSNDWTARMVCC